MAEQKPSQSITCNPAVTLICSTLAQSAGITRAASCVCCSSLYFLSMCRSCQFQSNGAVLQSSHCDLSHAQELNQAAVLHVSLRTRWLL